MIRYLLDADAVSNLVRDPYGPVAARIERHGTERIGTSIIAAAELRYGAAKKGSSRLLASIDAALKLLNVQPFAPPADRCYAELRTELERKGRPIGANDMLIAAHALALGCILVTGNRREFAFVRGLHVENWRT